MAESPGVSCAHAPIRLYVCTGQVESSKLDDSTLLFAFLLASAGLWD